MEGWSDEGVVVGRVAVDERVGLLSTGGLSLGCLRKGKEGKKERWAEVGGIYRATVSAPRSFRRSPRSVVLGDNYCIKGV